MKNHKTFILNAIAQQRFEGLTVSKETINDLIKFSKGQLTIDNVISNITTRYQKT
jgi:hypothetical protein